MEAARREEWLSPEDFLQAFGMTKEQFFNVIINSRKIAHIVASSTDQAGKEIFLGEGSEDDRKVKLGDLEKLNFKCSKL